MNLIYCVKCRKKTDTENLRQETTKNNRPILKGFCVVCGGKKAQFPQSSGKKIKKGGSILNKAINALPFEMHLPGHNFTGPGTNLKKRLNPDLTPKEWSKPVNRIDRAAMHHDICYLKNTDTKTRNDVCDRDMLQEMKGIYNPLIRERIERGLVSQIIGTKKRFGMGQTGGRKKKKLLEEKTLSDELHRPLRRNFPTRRVKLSHIDDTWTADLMFMPKKIKKGETEGKQPTDEPQPGTSRQTAAEKQTDNLNIFLVVLDVFSRFAWVRELPNKQVNNVAKAFEDIFKVSNRRPLKLWTDRGGEFTGLIDQEKPEEKTAFQCSNCNKYLKSKAGLTNHIKHQCPVLFPDKAKEEKTKLKGVTLYHTEGKNKASIAERFIKTLKDRIGRWMTDNNTTEYKSHLQEIVKEYNETPHRKFNDTYTPEEASKKGNEKKIYQKYYLDDKPKPGRVDYVTQKTRIEVTDRVRIPRRKKEGFEKGFTPNWTKEIFKVRKIKHGEPTTYYLKDANNHHIQGAFYRQELQKTKSPFMAWMGDTKPRTKENVSLGMEAVAAEAKRQKEKKQRQRDRKKEEQKKGEGLEISKRVKNLPITTLTNFDLTNVCKNLKGWRDVFSRDALPKKPNVYKCGILSLDDTEGPGTHWTAWHRKKKKNIILIVTVYLHLWK